ncbi:MAG TPA: FtsL-like putative cell division protein [Bacteroidales bacterium]|nr:FtsL-like putative cell division protein [Bacteroidales bacterium]
MQEEKINKERAGKETGKAKSQKGAFVKELLSGSMISEKIILSNLGYVTFVTILLAFYIANRFHAEKITRETSKIQREVKDLRAEALSTSADLMHISRQSEVYRLVKERGLNLEELKTPAYRLIVSTKDSKWQREMK